MTRTIVEIYCNKSYIMQIQSTYCTTILVSSHFPLLLPQAALKRKMTAAYTSTSRLRAKKRVECPLRHGKQLIRHGNHQFNGWPNLQRIAAITLANVLIGVCQCVIYDIHKLRLWSYWISLGLGDGHSFYLKHCDSSKWLPKNQSLTVAWSRKHIWSHHVSFIAKGVCPSTACWQ